MPFKFEVGKKYGDMVEVVGRTDLIGYECVVCSIGTTVAPTATMQDV